MRLVRRGHEICSESTERNIQHKKMGLSGDEGSKDPIYPRLSFSQLPWEIRGGGMMTQRLRIRSYCLLPVSLCHPWLLCGRIPFSLLQSHHSEEESISKVIPNLGSFFHDFCHSSSVPSELLRGRPDLFQMCVWRDTSCQQIILESSMDAVRKKTQLR